MPCPLCNHNDSADSWLGTTVYRERKFTYVECLACHSLYCQPMPDAETLGLMYGVDYQSSDDYQETADENSKYPPRALKLLKKLGTGVFIDYGCGKGALLTSAQRMGWESFGVEFSPEVAAQIEQETKIKIFCTAEPPDSIRADVLHLGDVIEHLTDLDRQMPEILRWLKPGGWLVAQGPLEAHRNLFTFAIKAARRMKKDSQTTMPPYHVILATSRGQRSFFERFGLTESEYSVFEVDFPAPPKLTFKNLSNPRLAALFGLRKASQAVSAALPGEWGNRYFYCGRFGGDE